jgi:tRNA A58 N-methylase Trm61
MDTYVAEYIAQLNCEVLPETQNIDNEVPMNSSQETLTPLTERIQKLIATLPECERNTPKTMEFFQTRLRGRKGKTAHVGEIANALRYLKFSRKRAWSKAAGGFRAYWHPNGL